MKQAVFIILTCTVVASLSFSIDNTKFGNGQRSDIVERNADLTNAAEDDGVIVDSDNEIPGSNTAVIIDRRGFILDAVTKLKDTIKDTLTQIKDLVGKRFIEEELERRGLLDNKARDEIKDDANTLSKRFMISGLFNKAKNLVKSGISKVKTGFSKIKKVLGKKDVDALVIDRRGFILDAVTKLKDTISDTITQIKDLIGKRFIEHELEQRGLLDKARDKIKDAAKKLGKRVLVGDLIEKYKEELEKNIDKIKEIIGKRFVQDDLEKRDLLDKAKHEIKDDANKLSKRFMISGLFNKAKNLVKSGISKVKTGFSKIKKVLGKKDVDTLVVDRRGFILDAVTKLKDTISDTITQIKDLIGKRFIDDDLERRGFLDKARDKIKNAAKKLG